MSCRLNSRVACSHLMVNAESWSGTCGATRVVRPFGVRVDTRG